MSNLLKDDLLSLKNRLENIETQLEGQMKDLETREDKWKKMDEQVSDIIKNQNEVVKLNIGGKKFSTRTETLLGVKDTLFYKLILSKKFDLNEEIFFDRSPKVFNYLLDFIRYKRINYKRFNKEELEELRIEAEYFEIGDISGYLEERTKEIDFLRYEYSGPYVFSGQTAGNGKVEDLKDRSLLTGICTTSPGWIIIELNAEWEFDEMEVGGWTGNPTLWSNANGVGAQIQTSLDKVTWKTVGTVPSTFSTAIQTVKLTRSSGRYVKFNHTSYFGVGFVGIKKISS